MGTRILTVALTLAATALGTAQAAEGGSSFYRQGIYNDFGAAMPLEPGVHVRNDLLHYRGHIGPTTVAPGISASGTQDVWGDLVKIGWITDTKILGGTYSAAVVIPIALNATVGSTISGPGFTMGREDHDHGVGDLFVVPLRLTWTLAPDHHVAFATNVGAPTGSYRADRTINMGRNYWAFDPFVQYTWLDRQRGHEVSVTAGMMFNERNDATNYRTGNEFHVDWLVAQHFSRHFGAGLVGYFYRQVTDDTGDVPASVPQGFRGVGAGLGLALRGTMPLAGHDVTVIGKWIKDTRTENRFEGETVMLSVSVGF